MIKYVMTATALKLFSSTSQTKRFYRLLGNAIGPKIRNHVGLNKMYLDRAKMILDLCERHHVIQSGGRLLEIGTGWLHWESTIIRLFYDVAITLSDIVDNRQLEAYKHYLGQLKKVIDEEIEMSHAQHERVHGLLQNILNATSFDEIYDLLDFHYVINPSGTLQHLQDESFTLIYSSSVLEHIDKCILPEFIHDYYRLLKPGGHSIDLIDLSDHLYWYDESVSIKNYLRYSDKTWRRYFENDVQYINRVQRPEWLDLYCNARLELVEEEPVTADIGIINIDESYKNLDNQNLQCVTLRVVHEKPHQPS